GVRIGLEEVNGIARPSTLIVDVVDAGGKGRPHQVAEVVLIADTREGVGQPSYLPLVQIIDVRRTLVVRGVRPAKRGIKDRSGVAVAAGEGGTTAGCQVLSVLEVLEEAVLEDVHFVDI